MVGWGVCGPQADGPLTLPSPALGRGDRLRVGVWVERMVGWGVCGLQADDPLTLPSAALGRGIGKFPPRNV